MAEENGFENGRNSNFEGLVTLTLTLTLDPAIRHTVMHHSSTSTYIPNFIQIEETFCGRTDGRTDGCTDGRTYGRTDIFSPSNIIRSTFGSRPKYTEPLNYCTATCHALFTVRLQDLLHPIFRIFPRLSRTKDFFMHFPGLEF